MENFNFRFSYNFDSLDMVKLHTQDGITPNEIIQVFERNTFRLRQEGGPALEETVFIKTDYSKERRIILIAFVCDGETVYFIGAKIADEEEIDLYYCGQ
jgi:hypothetical protein